MIDRGDNEDYATEIEVPAETLADTNYDPKPATQKNGADRAPRDLPGRDELERQIQRLTRTSDDAKKRAAEAETALAATQRRAVEDVGRLRQETIETRRQSVATSRAALEAVITETEASLSAAKSQLKQGVESGDGDMVVAAQTRISELTYARMENMRRRDTLPTEEQVAAEATRVAKDPSKMTPAEKFEAYVEQFHPKAQEWLRKHPEFASDTRLNRKLARAHDEATLDKDIVQNTPEYFDFLNQRLGLQEGDDDDGYFENDDVEQQRENDVQRSRGTIEQRGSDRGARQLTDNRNTRPVRSAPVRGGSDTATVRGSRVRVGLTEGEIQNATDGTLTWGRHDAPNPDLVDQPIGTTEFARRKALMRKAGRYNMPSE